MAMDPLLQNLMKYVQSLPEEEVTPDKALALAMASGRSMQPNGVERFTVKGGDVFQNQAGSFSRSERPIAQYGTLANALADPAVARFKGLAAQGLPESVAKDVISQETKSGQESLAALQDKAAKAKEWLQLADDAKSGIDAAGNTGFVPNLAGWLASAVSDDQASKQAGNAKLDSIQGRVLALSKVPGSGPLSDADMKRMMAQIPTSDKSRAQNLALLDNLTQDKGRDAAIYQTALELTKRGMPAPEAERQAQILVDRQLQSQESGPQPPQQSQQGGPPPPRPGESKADYIRRLSGI